MKKLMAFVACAAMVTTLTACGNTDAPEATAKYAKVGFGTVVSVKEKDGAVDQVNTTMATVGLDSEGKIAYLDIDVAQSKPAQFDERTKDEKKEDYGMAAGATEENGQIGKEWYEQVNYLEEKAVGMTPEEFLGVAVEEGKYADDVLAAGCTISVGDFITAVEEAVANAVEVNAEKIGAGEVTSFDEKKGQVVTDMAVVALDAEGKVAWATFDTAQSLNGKDETKTKVELKEEYGMLDASAGKGQIEGGAELYTQLDNLAKALVGKEPTLELAEGYLADADLFAGCTIHANGYAAALAEAVEAAK